MSEQAMTRRVAAVSGAAQGLGAQVALRLAADGFSVVLLDLRKDGIEKTRLAINARSPEAETLSLTADLSDEAAVAQAFAAIEARYGRLDALVNTAGGSGTDPIRSLDDVTADVWRRVLDNNLTSAFLCSRAAVRLMERHGYGRIVNFSSAIANGKAGPSGTVGARLPYATSKAAINGLTKQLAKDLARTGITVNAVSPGLVIPIEGRIRDTFESLPEKAQAATRASIPAGRTGTGDEIAAAVAYLVSDDAGFTTGAILAVDGGES